MSFSQRKCCVPGCEDSAGPISVPSFSVTARRPLRQIQTSSNNMAEVNTSSEVNTGNIFAGGGCNAQVDAPALYGEVDPEQSAPTEAPATATAQTKEGYYVATATIGHQAGLSSMKRVSSSMKENIDPEQSAPTEAPATATGAIGPISVPSFSVTARGPLRRIQASSNNMSEFNTSSEVNTDNICAGGVYDAQVDDPALYGEVDPEQSAPTEAPATATAQTKEGYYVATATIGHHAGISSMEGVSPSMKENIDPEQSAPTEAPATATGTIGHQAGISSMEGVSSSVKENIGRRRKTATRVMKRVAVTPNEQTLYRELVKVGIKLSKYRSKIKTYL